MVTSPSITPVARNRRRRRWQAVGERLAISLNSSEVRRLLICSADSNVRVDVVKHAHFLHLLRILRSNQAKEALITPIFGDQFV